ncbi:MAG: multidrug efflux RND transporter permease subunit [Pseudomonadota bacterium]
MGFFAYFVYHPVATTLLTLAIALAGWLGFRALPVAPLPQIDFPTISVQASLPGASPEVMASSVAAPLERALGRIAGLTEMTSQSSLGSTRVTLQFDLSRDIEGAARDVQAGINAARSLLPPMPSNPSYRKVNPADAPVMIIALTSKTMGRGVMYDLASTVLAQKIAQVQGVGQVDVGGASLPAVRVELNPNALNQRGISAEQVRAVIASTNSNRPKGFLESDTQHWTIGANDQASKAADYAPLIVSYKNNAVVRLSDVARVEDSVQDVRNAGLSNGEPSILLMVRRQPGANVIETVDNVRALVPQMQSSVPAAIQLKVMSDSTRTIRSSLHEIEVTLVISVILVVGVVFLFLRSIRATLIPAIVIPVSLLGTCGFLYLGGYSLNNLSLMALIVAAGFVVDDAVVVLENIARHIEKGMEPVEAAIQGVSEVAFTVVSMSISLIAVFIPILFMGGIMGRLFQEFAITLSMAILVSLVISLTTTPMLCARWLIPDAPSHHKNIKEKGFLSVFSFLSQGIEKVEELFEGGFNRLKKGYEHTLAWVLKHPLLIGLILIATIILNVYLYIQVPKGFMPQQDTGRLMGMMQADQGLSFLVMEKKLQKLMAIVQKDPAVDGVVGFVGGGNGAGGRLFVTLKPLAERHIKADQIVARIRGKTSNESGVSLFLQSVQDIRVGGRAGNAQYQYTLEADDLSLLREWSPKIRAGLARLPDLTDISSDQQDRGLQTTLNIDRDKAARLGIDMRTISTTLNNLFGQRQVSVIYNAMNQYRIVMEADSPYRESAESLAGVYVTTAQGETVPLTSFAHWEATLTPLAVNRQGQFVATTISFNLAPGKSLSDAEKSVRDTFINLGVPASVRGSFQGTAKVFQASTSSQPLLILAALVTIYLVLGMLYENLLHPLTILSTLPSAGVGSLLAVLMLGAEFNLMTLIGVILLIGLVKKNAIMVIDVALELQQYPEYSAKQAIYEACLLRFRPIMMTTAAALLGAIPLTLGIGEGAELRQPLGIAMVGGLLVSQVLTLYTTPVVFIGMEALKERMKHMHLWKLRHV